MEPKNVYPNFVTNSDEIKIQGYRELISLAGLDKTSRYKDEL